LEKNNELAESQLMPELRRIWKKDSWILILKIKRRNEQQLAHF